jgi:homoserine O-succinyltransferase/O-acetyltransferase
LVLDGVRRTALPVKRSGVFPQHIEPGHPLVRDLDDLPLPHSRYNDVPTATLVAHGYAVLASSPEVGWSVAARDDGPCLVVLAQGHPEYAPDTLLREYRRDVRRYLEGSAPAYPALPNGYLDPDGADVLGAFAAQAAGVRAAAGPAGGAALMEAFPFEAAARHVRCGWRPAAEGLVANWLDEIATRTRASVLR